MRTLVIEDDPQLQKLLRRGLAEGGLSVDTAADGETGLHLAAAESYDAIVLDLMLPKLAGLELLRELRARGRNTPVLILTARDALADKIAGLDRGADDYLTKPFAVAELLARLRALIRRDHRAASSTLVIADLEVDLAARRVRRAGRGIELSAKQFALLELLALHRGQIVTRTQIYDKIYDGDADTLSNVVDVHVCRLREAVDRGFALRLIHTVRGQGYLLVAKEDEACRCAGD
jgi:two-component system copper resistance phosphate regulon response regulator CusR